MIAFGIVALAALVVEAGVVALFLIFSGLFPLRTFGAFFLINFAVFAFLFFPLLRRIPLPLLEVIVVVVDGAAIKLLTFLSAFQGDEFQRVSWQRAGLASVAGNAASFFVGVMGSGSPWEHHEIYK